jgi:hypothetical protein
MKTYFNYPYNRQLMHCLSSLYFKTVTLDHVYQQLLGLSTDVITNLKFPLDFDVYELCCPEVGQTLTPIVQVSRYVVLLSLFLKLF